MPIPFAVPSFAGDVAKAATEVLDSGWVTTGPRTTGFEEDLAAYLGARHVVATASCTAALELCLRAMELPENATVLTPSLTFCGAVNAIVHARLRPLLVDVDEETLIPTPATVAAACEGSPPAAMIVCHMAGYPADVAPLAEAAGLPRERVIEDIAHGPGGSREGSPAGAESYAACFSFYATKNMPIGEGGAVATSDEEFAARISALRLHGMSKDAWRRYLPGGSWQYDVPQLGLKANMTDLQAAIGSAQLRALPAWLDRRAGLAARYDILLRDIPRVTLPQRRSLDGGLRHAWHIYQVRVPQRDEVAATLAGAGISTSVHFIPVHHFSAYQRMLGEQRLPGTDRVAAELLSLPFYPGLEEGAQERVAEMLAKAVAACE